MEPKQRYSSVQASRISGVSFRRVDHWDKEGVLSPSIQGAAGSGSQRWYSAFDIRLLAVALQLRETGVPLDIVGRMVTEIRALGEINLAARWIVIVGAQCFVVSDPDSALALLEPGQVAHVLRPAPLRELALA